LSTEDLTHSLAMAKDPADLHEVIGRRFREMTGCDAVVLLAYNETKETFELAATSGAVPILEKPADVAAHGSLARWLRANNVCLVASASPAVTNYLDQAERTLMEQLSVQVCIPLMSLTRLSGILLLIGPPGTLAPRSDELSFWMLCGRHAGLACESASLQRAERDHVENMLRAEQLAVAGQLAAEVAHEVRNPLTAIRSTLQLVVDSDGSIESKRELLRMALDEVDRIDGTIAGILTLSRPTEVERQDLDLVEVVEQAARLVYPYAQEHHFSLSLDLARRPLEVTGDFKELRQVFVNLLLNACQAMVGSGVVTVASDLVAVPGEPGLSQPMAAVRIVDTGSGMSPDQIARAFELFFTTKKNGTGLGLPICLGIVKQHGGRILLESDSAGTTVTVLLPLREPNLG
jgi:signal transduction histidine kinase